MPDTATPLRSGTGGGRPGALRAGDRSGDPLRSQSAGSPRRAVTGPRTALIAVFVAAAVAGCGGSSSETTTTVPATIAPATVETPETLELGRQYTFQIPDGTPSTRLSFDVPPGGVVTLAASADAANTSGAAMGIGPAGQTVRRLDLNPGQAADPVQYITSSETGGGWILEIQGVPGNVVVFQVDAPLQADGGVAGDAGPHAGVASAIEVGTPLNGLLGGDDSADWYSIPLSGGDVVSVTMTAAPDELNSGVRAEIVYNGSAVARTSVGPGGEESLLQVFSQEQTGEAQLMVSGVGSYGFTVEAGPQRDGGSDGDAGGDIGNAKDATLGTIEGVIGGADTEDFFVLPLPPDAVLSGELSTAPDTAGGTRIELLFNGRAIVSHNLSPGQTEGFFSPMVNEDGSELIVRVAGQAGTYRISLDATTQPDGGDGSGDAGNEQGVAKEITAEGSFQGYLNNGGNIDGRDWYRFTAVATGPLTIGLSIDPIIGANTRLQVHMVGGARIGDLQLPAGATDTVVVDVVAGAEYTMEVATGQVAAYTVTFG
jgi:hypothetical protein